MKQKHRINLHVQLLLLFSYFVMSDSVTPWTAACQSSLSFTIYWSMLKLMSLESVMPSSHLILCCPFLPLLSIFSRLRVFYQLGSSHQVAKVFRSFSISPSKECSGLISFRRLTGLICLQSKGCSRVFFSTTFCKHQLFGAQLSLRSNSDIHTWLLGKQYLWLPW